MFGLPGLPNLKIPGLPIGLPILPLPLPGILPIPLPNFGGGGPKVATDDNQVKTPAGGGAVALWWSGNRSTSPTVVAR